MDEVIVRQPQKRSSQWSFIWGGLLAFWMLLLCFLPDPRPLGAPQWAVALVQKLIGVSEPSARAVATFTLRVSGIALLGFLVSLTLSNQPTRKAILVALIASPILGITALWINIGYYPLFFQSQIGIASAIVGSLAGLACRKSTFTKIAFAVVTAGLFLWGTSTGISEDVNETARITGHFVLEHSDLVQRGDQGFTEVVEAAFQYAEDNSHRTDAAHTNKAVIVALGVIIGEERIATVAHRKLSGQYSKQIAQIRRQITLRERNDLARHFWVSAALAVLADADQSMTVGITKELMDATPGGSGFSFVDLMADRAGTLFAIAATKDDESARHVQQLIRQGVSTSDFCPPINDLPEGIPMDEFEAVYGGLNGEQTTKHVHEIQQRLESCKLLSPLSF